MQAENNTREPECPDQHQQRHQGTGKRYRHSRPPGGLVAPSTRESLARQCGYLGSSWMLAVSRWYQS
jgi:hypothetical protein